MHQRCTQKLTYVSRGEHFRRNKNILISSQHSIIVAWLNLNTSLCIFFMSISGMKLSYMPFFLKAASMALLNYPVLNSSLDETKCNLIYKVRVNLLFYLRLGKITTFCLVITILKDKDINTRKCHMNMIKLCIFFCCLFKEIP